MEFYRNGSSLHSFPSTVTSSASVILMPSVAEMQALGHRRKIRYITRTPVLPVSFSDLMHHRFYFGGNFAGTILFHNTDAGLYIRTLSFICPFLYTNIALTSILNGLGKPEQHSFTVFSGFFSESLS